MPSRPADQYSCYKALLSIKKSTMRTYYLCHLIIHNFARDFPKKCNSCKFDLKYFLKSWYIGTYLQNCSMIFLLKVKSTNHRGQTKHMTTAARWGPIKNFSPNYHVCLEQCKQTSLYVYIHHKYFKFFSLSVLTLGKFISHVALDNHKNVKKSDLKKYCSTLSPS